MISRRITRRPENWANLMAGIKHRWIIPFRVFEWMWEWLAYALSRWSFLEVLEYLGSFSVLIGVIFYFSESGDRVKQRHYQAWQVINTAQGKGGSGGRIEALQELNEDHVQLVGVDAASAFLQAIRLEHANLLRADLSASDLRGCDLSHSILSWADLHSANLRGGKLEQVVFSNSDMHDADLMGADLEGAKLDGVDLSSADLRLTILKGIEWKRIKSVKGTDIAGVKDAPADFVKWALANGAVETSMDDN